MYNYDYNLKLGTPCISFPHVIKKTSVQLYSFYRPDNNNNYNKVFDQTIDDFDTILHKILILMEIEGPKIKRDCGVMTKTGYA